MRCRLCAKVKLPVRQLLRLVTCLVAVFGAIILYDVYLNDSYLSIDVESQNQPFWKYNRTRETGRVAPVPVRTTDQVDLSNATAVFSACCRNVLKHLPGFRNNVEDIARLFKDYRILLGESDSYDGTSEYVERWANADPKHVKVYHAGHQFLKLKLRTQRLADCRNTLWRRAQSLMSRFDYYVVLDVDVTWRELFNRTGFLANFVYPSSSWAVMTASYPSSYYDVWALRSSPSFNFDFRLRARQYSILTLPYRKITERLISKHYGGIPDKTPLIEVESAFGGAAIYRREFIDDECVYDGWLAEGFWLFREQCEHVSFNLCVVDRAGPGMFFINPRFHATH